MSMLREKHGFALLLLGIFTISPHELSSPIQALLDEISNTLQSDIVSEMQVNEGNQIAHLLLVQALATSL